MLGRRLQRENAHLAQGCHFNPASAGDQGAMKATRAPRRAGLRSTRRLVLKSEPQKRISIAPNHKKKTPQSHGCFLQAKGTLRRARYFKMQSRRNALWLISITSKKVSRTHAHAHTHTKTTDHKRAQPASSSAVAAPQFVSGGIEGDFEIEVCWCQPTPPETFQTHANLLGPCCFRKKKPCN